MTIARRLLVPANEPGIYHCISRCVRRAFLCGGEFEHRRGWIRDRLRELADIFAIDVATYAVMNNHLHTVLRRTYARSEAWSAHEVVERWSRLFPKSILRWAGLDPRLHTEGEDIPTEVVATVAADESRVERLRRRLASLSWFTKCLKEPIARRANREDGCTGHFWEGRFRSHRLLDDAAVLACMVYNDLNVIRAGLAPTPEQSDYTSVGKTRDASEFPTVRVETGETPPCARMSPAYATSGCSRGSVKGRARTSRWGHERDSSDVARTWSLRLNPPTAVAWNSRHR